MNVLEKPIYKLEYKYKNLIIIIKKKKDVI